MLTPKFEVNQDDNFLTIKIFAAYAKISDAEVNIDGDSFTFHSSPYYLRLTFEGKLVDSEMEQHKATFDADIGAFIIKCKKEMPGHTFPNLDMLTTLLTPHGATGVKKPSIEVIGGDAEEEEEEDEEDIDWHYPQSLPEDKILTGGHKYGFANTYTGVFSSLQNELKGVIDIVEPDNKSSGQRREERICQELSLFDEDHYLADFFEVDTAKQCVQFIPIYYSITADEVELTELEKEELLKLPRKEHLLEAGTRSIVYLGIVDLIYAWAYNHRINMGEKCVESAWNIAKISSTLSWLDSFTQLKDVAVSCVRRSLTFPLIRNWHLSQQVLKDTIQILLLGHKKVLQCLLEMQRLFYDSEHRYLLNQLYITDYCVYIQKVKDNKLISLADSLKKVKVTKSDMGLDLEDLETAAQLVLEEEDGDNICSQSGHNGDNLSPLIADIQGLTIENGAALHANDNEGDNVQPGTILGTKSERSEPLSDDSSSDDDSDSSDSDDSDSSDSDSSDSDSSDLDSDDDTLSENDDNENGNQ